MAERTSFKPAAISAPTLTPQGQLAGKPAMPLSRPFTLVGSRNRAHLHLISSSISRNHCCIIVTDNGLYVRDLASRSGVMVNGQKVREVDLRDGNSIQIGSFKFKFSDPAGPVRFPITPKAVSAVLHFDGINTEIDARSLTIGRRSTCDIPLNDDSVSNTHAIIFESNGERFIRDLGSRTGTLVNGRPVHHQLLNFGDTIRIGSTEIQYNSSDVEASSVDDLEPLELEPIELEPVNEEVAASVAPRRVDDLSPIALDNETGDTAEHEDSVPIAASSTSDNGAIPLDLEDEPATHGEAEHSMADEPEVEPADTSHAGAPIGLEPIEEEAGAIQPTSFAFVPHDSDPKADSVYSMSFSATEGSVTAAEPFEPESIPLDAEPEPVAAESIADEPAATNHDVAAAEESTDASIPEIEDQPSIHSAEPTEEVVALEPEAEAQPIEPELAVTEGTTFTLPEEPAIEESSLTAPVEIEQETAIDSTSETAAGTDDFTPTLDVATADAPTAFEQSAFTDGSAAAEEKPAAVNDAVSGPAAASAESAPQDAGWTLSVSSDEDEAPPASAADGAATAETEASQLTADVGTPDVQTSSTDEAPQHPVRPELPPDTQSESISPAMPVVVPPVAAPDLAVAGTTAAAAIAAAALASTATKRGRGRAKATPKPAPAPKGGRRKKGVAATPEVAESPAPIDVPPPIESAADPAPVPAPSKKRGGRKKAAPPTILPPVELAPVETYVEPAAISEDSITLSEPGAEPAVEPEVVASPESSLTVDSTISLEPSESQDFSGSSSMPAVALDEITAPAVEEIAASETPAAEADAAASEPTPPPEIAAEDTQIESDVPAAEVEADQAIDLAESVTIAAEPEVTASEIAEPEVELAEPQEFRAIEPPIESPADEVEPDIDVAPIEVLEPTDPTPESAQVLEPELAAPLVEEPELDETVADLSLTDTAFGRAVVDLGSSDSAPLVEDSAQTDSVDAEESTQSVQPEATHHLAAAYEEPAPGQESFDVTLPPDAAVGTAADDAITESHAGEASPSEIDEIGLAALVDDAPNSEEGIEPVGGVELIELQDTNAQAVPASTAENESDAQEFEAAANSAGDDFELPDMDLNFDLGSDDEPGLGVAQPTVTAPIVNAAANPFEPESLTSSSVAAPAAREPAPSPAAPDPVQPVAEAPKPQPPAPATDPFFGMNRDLASFLGGVPLTLTAATPIAAPAAAAAVTAFSTAGAIASAPKVVPAPQNPVTPPANPVKNVVSELDEDIPEIDFSGTDEPLDLFEHSGDKLDEMPDTLAPISDVTNVLSTGPKAPVSPPAPAATPTSAPPPTVTIRPAAPAMRNVTPPPPPKSAPLRSFTSNVNTTPPPMVPGAGAGVSFGGAPGAAGLTAPFGAVGTPQTRQVDVFSHTAFPPLDPTVFSAAPQRPAAPRAVTPGAASQRQAMEAADDQSSEDDMLGIEPDSLPDLNTTPTRRTAIPPNQQTPVARAVPAPVKKPWWKNLKILLPLLVVAIIVVILVVMFLQPKPTVQGTLQIQGVDSQNQATRRAQAEKIRDLILKPHVHDLAVNILAQKGISPGFINDPQALATLADSRNSPFESTDGDRVALKLNRTTSDLSGDTQRMRALLAAIYTESGASNDEAVRANQKRQDDEKAVGAQRLEKEALLKEISGIKDQLLASAGPSATNWLLDPQTALSQVQADELNARQVVDSASADVQKKRQALQDAQTAAAPADTNAAAESARVKKTMADLKVRLDAVRLAQAGHAEDAAKAFGTAIDAMDKALNDAAGGTLAPAPVTAARTAVGEIRELDGNLAVKTRDDAKTVAQLRRQIADQREAHLRQIWSADSSLQALVEERNAQSHRYGAAIDSNYADEATKIKGVLEELDRKIEARRSELATGSQLTDPLQQTLQQTIDRTEATRQAGETQIAQKLQTLSTTFAGAGAAAISSAPKLAQLASDALLSRQAYATASSLSTSSADAEARKLQLQIAEQQARLDSLQQEPDKNSPVEVARRDLDAAQAAEAKATNAFTKTHNNLALLQQLAPQVAKVNALDASLKFAPADSSEVASSPVVLKPDETTSVGKIYARDQRFIYLIGGIAAVFILFAAPLWLTIHESSSERESHSYPMVEPLDDPRGAELMTSDADSLFEPDTAHA